MRVQAWAEAKKWCDTVAHLIRSSKIDGDRIDIVEAVFPVPHQWHGQWEYYDSCYLSGNRACGLKPAADGEYDVVVRIRECYADGSFSRRYVALKSFLDKQSSRPAPQPQTWIGHL